MHPSIGIAGAGKVGSVLARLWYGAGYEIGAVYSKTSTSAQTLAAQVHATSKPSITEVVQSCDLILLSVPDDAIESVTASLTQSDWTNKAVIHASGATGMEVLDALAARGAMVGSLHPAFPFADVETAVLTLPGATFAIEFSHEMLREWLINLVGALNGGLIEIPPGGKAQYHAALCIASNYLVTLYSVAERLLKDLGAEQASVRHALLASVGGTVENLAATGIPWALTGPLARGDVGTIEKHLNALQDDPALKAVYIALARQTYPVLAARGMLDGVIVQLETLFNQD